MKDPHKQQHVAELQAHATLAHHEFVEVANRLIMEGMDCHAIIAGIGAAAADLIATKFGSQAAAPWFAKQAELIERKIGSAG